MPRDLIDLTGQTFDRWTVIGRAECKGGRFYWRCRCSCGKVKDVYSTSLRAGKSRSCGCLIGEVASINQFRHGHNRRNKPTSVYSTWAAMKQRCYDQNCK